MKATIEAAFGDGSFHMGRLYAALLPDIASHARFSSQLPMVQKTLDAASAGLFERTMQAIVRRSFLIQAVTEVGGSAKTSFRWKEELRESQRYCGYDECVDIAAELLDELASGWLSVPANLELLTLLEKNPILSYEAPIDYRKRVGQDDRTTPIHRSGNLGWTSDPDLAKMLKLRAALKAAATNPDARFFKGSLKNKMLLLAYLTGRAQTGEFKTNREARWEVHPRSPQYAVYTSCALIELKVTQQICDFEGFPAAVRAKLEAKSLLAPFTNAYRDPITLDPLSYPAFKSEVENPVHGSGNYQLGHMVPLNSLNPELAQYGHSAGNVAWITAEGNRIQGSLTLSEVRAMLRRVASNYEALGWLES